MISAIPSSWNALCSARSASASPSIPGQGGASTVMPRAWKRAAQFSQLSGLIQSPWIRTTVSGCWLLMVTPVLGVRGAAVRWSSAATLQPCLLEVEWIARAHSVLAGRAHPPLVIEQPALSLEPAAVADETSRGADQAVAGDDDREGVAAVRQPRRTGGSRAADGGRQLAVGARLAIGDPEQRPPHDALELAPGEPQGQLECRALAGEVLLELASGLHERDRRLAPLPCGAGAAA